jgi:hypothetical protein
MERKQIRRSPIGTESAVLWTGISFGGGDPEIDFMEHAKPARAVSEADSTESRRNVKAFTVARIGDMASSFSLWIQARKAPPGG